MRQGYRREVKEKDRDRIKKVLLFKSKNLKIMFIKEVLYLFGINWLIISYSIKERLSIINDVSFYVIKIIYRMVVN